MSWMEVRIFLFYIVLSLNMTLIDVKLGKFSILTLKGKQYSSDTKCLFLLNSFWKIPD